VKAIERKHYGKLAALGCIVCYREGNAGTPAEIHHLRHGMGAGQRNTYLNAIPLCHLHHRTGGHGVALHAGQETFETNYGTEEELLDAAKKLIGM
jgi:hypothetical protein